MDTEALKPILAGLVRHALTTIGGALVTGGYMQSSDTAAFVGGGMVVAGALWSWWQKRGQAQIADLLKKLTASKSHVEAVEKAEALPAPTPAAVDKAIVAAVTTVAKVLLIAFALSAFLAVPSALAQGKLTGNIVKDIQSATGSQPSTNTPAINLTGNVERDAQALWKKIQGLTKADLTYAIAKAKAANTNSSQVRMQCLQAISDANDQANGVDLKNPDGTPMTRPDPALATNIEDVAELVDNLSPQGKLFTSCAGAAQLFKTNTLAVINAVVTGVASIAALPAGL